MEDTEVPSSGGVIQSVKECVNFDAAIDHIRESKDVIIEVALYTGIGFLAGYLTKRYSSLLAMLVFFVGILTVLSKFEIVAVSINWNYVYQQLGIQSPLLTSDSLVALGLEWVRINPLLISGTVIGFLVGLRIG
jgi:hypothetical protein